MTVCKAWGTAGWLLRFCRLVAASARGYGWPAGGGAKRNTRGAEAAGRQRTALATAPCKTRRQFPCFPSLLHSASVCPQRQELSWRLFCSVLYPTKDSLPSNTRRLCPAPPCTPLHPPCCPPGVELGGALKNVVAIACGISDGLGFGSNGRAAIMTRGLDEITRLAGGAGGVGGGGGGRGKVFSFACCFFFY